MWHPGQLWACPGVWPWRSCDCHNQRRGGIEIPVDCWSAHWGTCGTIWTICHEHTGKHLLQVAWDVSFMFKGVLFKLLKGLKCKCEGLYACRSMSLNVYCIVYGATVMTHLAGAVNVLSCWAQPPTYMCWTCMQFDYNLFWCGCICNKTAAVLNVWQGLSEAFSYCSCYFIAICLFNAFGGS